MKVRGLSAIITVVVLAIALLLGSRYLKSPNVTDSDDMKSHLTPNLTQENLIKPTPRVAIQQKIENKEFADIHTHEEVEDESLLVKESSYSEVNINEMTQSQFVDLLKTTDMKLPTIADIKKLPAAAVHHTPGIVMQAGRDLGYIKEILKVHTSFEQEAEVFYEKCAKTKERPTSVRALCLTNLIELKKKNGKTLNLFNYPKDIVELSKLIIDI